MQTSKLDLADFAAILPRLDLSQPIDGCEHASTVLARLMQADQLIEAVRLCAHALPAREAVWWAARCARATAPKDLPDTQRQACELAEHWVRDRRDPTRRAAMDRAQAAGFTSAEAWVAVAAFWSGDSMSPPEQPKVPPAPHLTGTAVAGAVILASVRAHPERQMERLRRFLASAADIAGGGGGHLEPEAE